MNWTVIHFENKNSAKIHIVKNVWKKAKQLQSMSILSTHKWTVPFYNPNKCCSLKTFLQDAFYLISNIVKHETYSYS